MKRFLVIAIMVTVMMLTMGNSSCTSKNDTDKKQAAQTEKLAAEADRQVGQPGITNFTERKFVKYLYELRDQDGVSTFTYTVDMHGKLHFLCESIGYGIPYSAQFVNPEKPKWWSSGAAVTLPQPEPNGLFVPDGLSATWVLCIDDKGESVRPVYCEPEILVSPFKLASQDSYQ